MRTIEPSGPYEKTEFGEREDIVCTVGVDYLFDPSSADHGLSITYSYFDRVGESVDDAGLRVRILTFDGPAAPVASLTGAAFARDAGLVRFERIDGQTFTHVPPRASANSERRGRMFERGRLTRSRRTSGADRYHALSANCGAERAAFSSVRKVPAVSAASGPGSSVRA